MKISTPSPLGFPAFLVFMTALALSSCEKKTEGASEARRTSRPATVTDGGSRITFPPDNPGLHEIHSAAVRKRTVTIPVLAPARVVASISSGLASKERIILFETPDATSLYSQYRQSRVNSERTGKNLARVKEMFANQAANAKDLNEAETDAANARASAAEAEAKLRALGFNPVELENVAPGTVWLISDVPESQLSEVQKGEDVDIFFSSFPGVTYHGRADGLGEVVDPVTRTVKVRVSMVNVRGSIIPGMFARVDFGDPREGVVVLPTSSIVTVEGSDFVFVQTGDSNFERRQVILASSGAAEVVVLQGVADGERVVTSGAMLLKGLSFGY